MSDKNKLIKEALDLTNEVLEHSDDPWLLAAAQQLKTKCLNNIYENELSQGSD